MRAWGGKNLACAFYTARLGLPCVTSGTALLTPEIPDSAGLRGDHRPLRRDRRAQRIHRRLDPAPDMRDAGIGERQLDRAESPQHHGLVQVTHVADAEDASLQRCQAAAECHAVALL